MRTRRSAILGLVGLALVAASCVSLKRTPEARLFVLQPLVEVPATPVSREPVGIIGVETVLLPGHLDRPQLVTWSGTSELRVDEFIRWAEPLDDGITRTLMGNLAGLLPDHQLIRRPWSGRVKTRCRVQVRLRVFGLQPNGLVRLEGAYALLPDRSERAFGLQSVDLSEGPLPVGPEGETPPDPGVDAMNRLLETLSRQVADAIRTLPDDPPVDDAAGTAEPGGAGRR